MGKGPIRLPGNGTPWGPSSLAGTGGGGVMNIPQPPGIPEQVLPGRPHSLNSFCFALSGLQAPIFST